MDSAMFVPLVRSLLSVPSLAFVLAIGCADPRDPTQAKGPDFDPRPLALEPVPIDGPGKLEMSAGRPIGAYDALKLNKVWVTFDRRANVSDRDAARIRDHIRESLSRTMAATGLPIVDKPDACTLLVEIGILDIELIEPMKDEGSAVHFVRSWGEATVVQVLFDGATLQPLMRFALRRNIPGGNTGALTDGRDWMRIGDTLDRLLSETQTAFLAGLPIVETPPTKPGCRGGIYELRKRTG